MDEGELAPADALETPAVALAAVDALIEAHRSDIDAGVLRILGGPNTPGVSASAELSVAAARHARDRGLRLAMHVAESTAAVDRVREATGRTGVVDWLDHLDALPPGTVAAHCVHLTAAEIGLLAGRSVAVAHNPVSNLYLGDGIAPVPELLDAGVTVGLGTDGAASNDTQDLWEAMKVAALIQRVRPAAPRWLKPGEILRMATIGGAKAIGMEERIGSLEAGKRADVTLVRVGHAPHAATVHDVLAHLVFVARSLDVATVLIDGQVVVRDGRLTTVDAPALASAAQDRGRALAGRLATLG
jgi:5-methylthioadenosine/S-adenosylhomocysteine deaminase